MSHVDTSWFDDYFARNFDRLVRRARRSFRISHADAKDQVQQVFLELFLNARDGRIDVSSHKELEAFAWKRTTFRCLSLFGRTPRRFHIHDPEEVLPDLPAPPSTSSSPELAWEEQNGWKAVLDLVEGLPVRQQQHAVLVAQGFTPRERALALDIEDGAERVAWYRLRKRLKQKIETLGSKSGEETA